VPHIIGVCAPTGFSEEARRARLELPNVTWCWSSRTPRAGWLARHRDGGGPAGVSAADLRPEAANQKIERVRARSWPERSADLLTSGVSVRSVAERLDLPERLVEEGFARTATADPELRLSRKAGETSCIGCAMSAGQERGDGRVRENQTVVFAPG